MEASKEAFQALMDLPEDESMSNKTSTWMVSLQVFAGWHTHPMLLGGYDISVFIDTCRYTFLYLYLCTGFFE